MQDVLSDERFHVELHFSPGAYTLGKGTDIDGQGYRTQVCCGHISEEKFFRGVCFKVDLWYVLLIKLLISLETIGVRLTT